MKDNKLCDGYNPEMEVVHIKNAETLDEIIDSVGWPTIEMVGTEANEAAWLIVQHAISKPDFQRKCLKILKDEVGLNYQVAYLEDRIRFFEGRKQIYGTQFDWDESDQLSPHAIEDFQQVNQLRQKIGLISLEDKTKEMRAKVKNENQKPKKVMSKEKENF